MDNPETELDCIIVWLRKDKMSFGQHGVTCFLWITIQRLDNIFILAHFDTNGCLPLYKIGREGTILRKSAVISLMDNPATRFEAEKVGFKLSTIELNHKFS